MAEPAAEDPIEAAAANWERSGWYGGQWMRAALALARASVLTRQSVSEILARSDLTFARHEVLAVLYFSTHGEMSLGRISSQLFLHPASITSTVDGLERLGLVERVPNPEDRRGVRARITERGRASIEESTPALVECKSGLDALSEDEAAQLFHLLLKVRRAAGDLDRS
jgi:DNA-binding MarR family transcriptional regulator